MWWIAVSGLLVGDILGGYYLCKLEHVPFERTDISVARLTKGMLSITDTDLLLIITVLKQSLFGYQWMIRDDPQLLQRSG